MLTTSKIAAAFARDGFYVLDRVFSRAEMSAVKEEARNAFHRLSGVDMVYPESGVYVGMSGLSEVFRKLNADPRLVDPLQDIIGPDIEFWSDKLVFKTSQIAFGTPWHQDYPYWRGAHKYSIWIALDDATPENGCLKMLPGSHKSLRDHNGIDSEGIGFTNRLKSGEVDEKQAVTMAVAAGSAVIFHDLCLHASYPNPSGKDRWSLISTYRDASKDDFDYPTLKNGFMVRGKWTGKCLGVGNA